MTRTEAVLEALGIQIASRRGPRGWAHCPYHRSEEPTTFFVRLSGPRAGQAHCFSCKKGGTLVELVKHIRRCKYDEAKKFIENVGKGFQPPKAKVSVFRRPAVLGRPRFQVPSEIVFDKLSKWISGARAYAMSRGIDQEEVEVFKLGYAVDGTLSGRVVIPWISRTQTIVGYSARTFVDEEPKYKTPRETDNADFATMVGEHLWPTSVNQRGVVVVTEGALNAFAVRRALKNCGDINIAALGGSEINPVHLIKLATFGLVLVMTDPDAAGDRAADVIKASLDRHTPTRRVRLPENRDALDVPLEYLKRMIGDALRGST